jgi:hypothetical protein
MSEPPVDPTEGPPPEQESAVHPDEPARPSLDGEAGTPAAPPVQPGATAPGSEEPGIALGAQDWPPAEAVRETSVAGPAVAASVEDDLRLARLHLRAGLHRIARAELETLAGSGDLDLEGILDLAEARWRTGDLRGGGEAAAAYLALTARAGASPSGPLAHVIVAEASVASGHPREAAEAVGGALDRLADAGIVDVPAALDAIFAGIAPKASWPEARPTEPGPPTVSPAERAGRAAGASPESGEPIHDLLAEAAEALGAGDPATAAVVLALVLRLDATAAGQVVALLERVAADPATAGNVAAPSVALVRGDALRAIGRHDLARSAYADARRLARQGGPDTDADTVRGPLSQDDPAGPDDPTGPDDPGPDDPAGSDDPDNPASPARSASLPDARPAVPMGPDEPAGSMAESATRPDGPIAVPTREVTADDPAEGGPAA